MFPEIVNKFRLSCYWEASRDGGDNNGSNQSEQSNEQQNSETFETWLGAQPEEVKKKVQPLFDAHIQNLRNTVKATRQERDDFERQLREATGKLAKDSDERKTFEGLADQLTEANRRAEFLEQAPANNCNNPKAAYLLAKSLEAFDKKGNPDWKRLAEEAPQFFGEPPKRNPKKTSGSGTNNEPSGTLTMNDWIRQQAGRSN